MGIVILLIVVLIGSMFFVPGVATFVTWAGIILVGYMYIVGILRVLFDKRDPKFPENIEDIFDDRCSRDAANYEFTEQQVDFKTKRSSLLAAKTLGVQTSHSYHSDRPSSESYMRETRVFTKRFLFIDDQINIPYVVEMTMTVHANDNPDQYSLVITPQPLGCMSTFREWLTWFGVRNTHDDVTLFPSTASRGLIEKSRLLIPKTPA